MSLKLLSSTYHVSFLAAPDTDHKHKFSLTHFIHFSCFSTGLTLTNKPYDSQPIKSCDVPRQSGGSTQIPSLSQTEGRRRGVDPWEVHHSQLLRDRSLAPTPTLECECSLFYVDTATLIVCDEKGSEARHDGAPGGARRHPIDVCRELQGSARRKVWDPCSAHNLLRF